MARTLERISLLFPVWVSIFVGLALIEHYLDPVYMFMHIPAPAPV